MKALKLKSSPDNEPIFGRWISGNPVAANTPQLWDDVNKIEDFYQRSKDTAILDQWELVPIKIIVDRP